MNLWYDQHMVEKENQQMPTGMSRREFIKRSLIGTAAFSTLTGATVLSAMYPVALEPYHVAVYRYDVPLANLPAAFDGFRILQISDLHFGYQMTETRVQKVVQLANDAGADVIVNTGDNVLEEVENPVDRVWAILQELRAPLGVYAVLGNHDHWASTEKSFGWLVRSGQSLYKRAVCFQKNGERLWLGGAGDEMEDSHGIDEAFAHTPADDCKLCLAHNPDTADLDFKTNLDLMICGHTHGGQIRMPFYNKVITPRQLPVRNKRYDCGLVKTERTRLFISRGLGCSVLPLRFNCPPELALLTLRCA